MCVLSGVYDYYDRKFPKWYEIDGVEKDLDVEELLKMMEDFNKAKDAAKLIDELTGQKDCLDPDKSKLEERVAALEKRIADLEAAPTYMGQICGCNPKPPGEEFRSSALCSECSMPRWHLFAGVIQVCCQSGACAGGYFGKRGDWKCASFACYYEAAEKEFINPFAADWSQPTHICPKCGIEDVFPAHDYDWGAKDGQRAKAIKNQKEKARDIWDDD